MPTHENRNWVGHASFKIQEEKVIKVEKMIIYKRTDIF